VQVRLARALRGIDLEAGVLHAERLTDVSPEVAVEWFAACDLDQTSNLVDAAAIRPPGIGIEEQWPPRQSPGLAGRRVITHGILVPERIAEAGRVRQQIA